MDKKENTNIFVLDQYFDRITSNVDYSTECQSKLTFGEIYHKDFLNFCHLTYYGELQDKQLFVASIRHVRGDEEQNFISTIFRTSKESYYLQCQLPKSTIEKEEKLLDIILKKLHLAEVQSCKAIQHAGVSEKLHEFDRENDLRQSFKIGLISQYRHQIDVNEIFSNENLSSELEEFLNSIADRVQLKDFDKYRGDLDTKGDEHGQYSYFTIFDHHQLMLNIAPIIPSDHSDQEFIQRKRLVANSFLCLIFQEGEDCQFIPENFPGKMVQVYMTIQPLTIDNQLYYKINIWRRAHLRATTDPGGGIYKSDKSFRMRFLTLILRTMQSIFEGDFLYGKIVEQKQHVKHEHLTRLFSTFDLYHSSTSSNQDQQNTSGNSKRKKLKLTHSFKMPKQQYSSVLPRLTGALNKIKPKFHSSASETSLPSLVERQNAIDDQSTIQFQSRSTSSNSIQSIDHNDFDSVENHVYYSPLQATLSLVTNTLHSMTFDLRESPVSTLPKETIDEENLSDNNSLHDDEVPSD